MTQHWHCERCKTNGAVRYVANAGMWEVFQKVVQSHKRQSPRCPDVSRVRLPTSGATP